MVTITLHDADAITVLTLVKNADTRSGVPANWHSSLDRAESAFQCALLLCDCDKVGKEKEQ